MLAVLVASLLGSTPALAPAVQAPSRSGFRTLSHVYFEREPEQRHVLEAHYMLPDRARLILRFGAGQESNRTINYRFGDNLYITEPASKLSLEAEGERRLGMLRALELRRALFTWPEGFEWTGEGRVKRANLGDAGELQANLDEEGRPKELIAYDADEAEHESLRGIEWEGGGESARPRRFQLTYFGQPVWREDVEHLSRNIRFVDFFFTPRDRRSERAPFRTTGSGLEHVDLPSVWRRRFELGEVGDWTKAWERAREIAAREERALRGRGVPLTPALAVEVTTSGAPGRVVLSIPVTDAPAAALPDWDRFPTGIGVRVGMDAPGAAAREGQRKAQTAMPEGARAGIPYVRALEATDGTIWHLVLPLLPPAD